jgi:NMD protein affecting ribosome stability and mRNA decay
MGHYCRICGRERPNELFSGKGHRIHVCKRCNAKPKSEWQVIEDKDDIFGFMHQSHISERNVARLEQMTKSANPQVASLAAIVLKVARVKPYKSRRLKFLAQMHPELLRNLEDTGLVLAHARDSETTEVPAQANSEETEIFVREDLEATGLSAQEDWEIPFEND